MSPRAGGRTSAGHTAVERLEPLVAVALSLALAVPLLTVDGFVPTHDGLQHLLHGYLWNHLDDPDRTWSVFLERSSPITAWGFTWLFAPLEPLLGWRMAYQIVLTIVALGAAWSFRAVVHAVARRRSPLGLLGFAAAMGWTFYMGFLPFSAASAAGLAVVAFAFRRQPLRPLEWFVLSAALLVVAMMHTMPAALCGATIFVVRTTLGRPRRLREAALCACAGLPAFAVAVATAAIGGETVESLGGETHALWQPWSVRLADLANTSVAGPPWRSWPVVFAALAGVVAGIARAATMRRAPKPDPAPVVAAGVSVIAFGLALAMPFHTSAWEYLGPRPLGIAIALGVAALAAAVPARRDTAALVVAAALAATALAWSAEHDATLARSAAAATASIDPDDPPDRRGWILPIVYDVYGEAGPDAVAYAMPLGNIGHVFVIEEGGMTPYLFASSPSMHQHVFRSDVRAPQVPDRAYFDAPSRPEMLETPQRLAAVRTGVLSAAPDYEAVIVWGDPETVALMRARGFEMEYDDGALAVGRFDACPLELRIDGPADIDTPSVEIGWYPALDAGRPEPVLPIAPGRWLVRPGDAPCGDVWVRIRAAADGTPLRCYAAPGDTIVLPVGPALGPVPCSLEPWVQAPPGVTAPEPSPGRP